MKDTGKRVGRPPMKPPRPAKEIAAELKERAQYFLDTAALLEGKDLKLTTKIKR